MESSELLLIYDPFSSIFMKPYCSFNMYYYGLLLVCQIIYNYYICFMVLHNHRILFTLVSTLLTINYIANLSLLIIVKWIGRNTIMPQEAYKLLSSIEKPIKINMLFFIVLSLSYILFIITLQIAIVITILYSELKENTRFFPLIFIVLYLYHRILRPSIRDDPIRCIKELESIEMCFDFLDISSLILIANYQKVKIQYYFIIITMCFTMLICFRQFISILLQMPFSYIRAWRFLGFDKKNDIESNLHCFSVILKRKINIFTSLVNFLAYAIRLFIIVQYNNELCNITLNLLMMFLIKNFFILIKIFFQIENKLIYYKIKIENNLRVFIKDKELECEKKNSLIISQQNTNCLYIQFKCSKWPIKTIFDTIHVVSRVIYSLFMISTQIMFHFLANNQLDNDQDRLIILSLTYCFLLFEITNNIFNFFKLRSKAYFFSDIWKDKYFNWGIVFIIICFIVRVSLGFYLLRNCRDEFKNEWVVNCFKNLFLSIFILCYIKGKVIFWFFALFSEEENFLYRLENSGVIALNLLSIEVIELEILFDIISAFNFFIIGSDEKDSFLFLMLFCILELLSSSMYHITSIFNYIIVEDLELSSRIKNSLKLLRLIINITGFLCRMIYINDEYLFLFSSKNLIQVFITIS